MENLMNNAHKAHTVASRANHEETFGHKCHWHGCRAAVTWKAGLWLCQSCLLEFETQRDSIITQAKARPCGHPGCLNHVSHPCEGCGRVAGRDSEKSQEYGFTDGSAL